MYAHANTKTFHKIYYFMFLRRKREYFMIFLTSEWTILSIHSVKLMRNIILKGTAAVVTQCKNYEKRIVLLLLYYL